MTDGPTYVLDANVFIQAARRYYAFDLAPAFWKGLIEHGATGRIRSIDRIEQEMERGKDELARWVRDNFSHAFTSTDEADVIHVFREIMTWVQARPQYSDAAKAGFANVADGWLVAYAKAKSCVVVTHEQPDPNIKRKVPIPNVCVAFGVSFVDTFEMLRTLGVRLG